MPHEAHQRGRQLEEDVAAHLRGGGYETLCNVVLEGRSGASHEVDVLAEKRDGLTTFRVAVECKAWAAPVETDVVSKLAYVVDDLGLNKGIVACPGGCRSGAELAAVRLGIDLWDAGELARRLRIDEGGGARRPTSGEGGIVLDARLDPRRARLALRREVRGILRRETVAWSAVVWIPFYELQLAITRVEGGRRPTPLLSRCWTRYEALSGSLVEVDSGQWPTRRTTLNQGSVPPLLHMQQISRELRRTVDRLRAVQTAAAAERHGDSLRRLGVDPPVEAVDVEGGRLVHVQAHLALVRRRDTERLTAALPRRGVACPPLDAALTANLRHVLTAAGAARATQGSRQGPHRRSSTSSIR